MFELHPNQFISVLPLFDRDMPLFVRVISTLKDRTPGKVYVDNPQQPKICALSLNYYNVTFLGGAIDQEWIDTVAVELSRDQELILQLPSRFDKELRMPLMDFEVVDRFEFYDCPTETEGAPIPASYQLRRLDQDLFKRCTWYDEIVFLYGSAENFLQDGIGLCLMDGEEICCEAYATCHDAAMIEIGVITNEKYRSQGLACITCKNLMQVCRAEGFSTYWVCHQANTASAATAQKLGYTIQKEFKWLVIPKPSI